MIVSLTSKHKGWFLDKKKLSKRQNIVMAICGLVFGICIFWTAIVSNIHIILKVILLFGFLFFGIGGTVLLIKQLWEKF